MIHIQKSIRKELFEYYEVEYDIATKIITIHKPVRMQDFIMLKHFFNEMDYTDIRVV